MAVSIASGRRFEENKTGIKSKMSDLFERVRRRIFQSVCLLVLLIVPFRLPAQTKQHPESTMSHSISTLLIRNLQDVFGENDPARRRAAIDEIWTADGVFYDPKTGVHRGRDEIDRIAGEIRATHPDFRYQPISKPEELGNAGRVQWVAGRPGEPPAYAGTDFIIVRDGRIAAIYLFFDELP